MKKSLLAIVVFLCAFQSHAQLLSWTPDFISEASAPVVITVDAAKGNEGLLDYASTSDVYVHTGVITNLSTGPSNWRYVKFNQNFNLPNPDLNATYLGDNKWQFTITGNIRDYYGVPAGESIQKITFLLRNGNGSKAQRNADGSDMYIPVYAAALAVRFTQPLLQPKYTPDPEPITKSAGDNIAVSGIANNPATLKLYLNGSVIQTAANATTISANPLISSTGNQTLLLEADNGVTTTKDSISFFANAGVTIAALPAGVREGINYEGGGSAATLVLFAPGKTRVSVIGDLPGSAWVEQAAYQMNKTPDGNYWWIKIEGLTPGTEYSYQYLVNGNLKIADPYAEKVLDPFADGSIPASTYPSLKAYPAGSTSGMVSILQTASPAYSWKVNNFDRPDKRNLLVYELLVRDFVAAHDWKTLKDTLNYIKNLGINTIELMPFNEFEGNNSWGYNPDFYFAPDKYYGPANTLKEFIDSCHSKGIAVVMDIALNHSFGLSPMVQLYFDNANNRPSADNPWFNATAKHPFNVGYDMNHESLATRYFVSRVVEHWLTNYKIDGFRFDLSKGFTQVNSCTTGNCDTNPEVSAWSNYDPSRIAIWKRYYDSVQLKSPGAYTILEHFAANQEEIELADYGMMFWGNLNYNYNQASMGYSTDWDFSNGIFTSRGWSQPNLVTYMESHDEERLMFKNIQYGNSAAGYNVKDTATALKRQELDAAFFFTVPGPKMVWQFGELGYGYSINFCENGTISNSCRLSPKPIRWDYLQDSTRRHVYDVYSALMKLRANPLYTDVFTSGQVDKDLGGAFKWLKVSQGISGMVVIGNFDVVPQTSSVTFPEPGTWFDYLEGTTIVATGAAQSFTLQPGEYHVYLNRNAVLPVMFLNFSGKNTGGKNVLSWTVTNEQNLARYELQRSNNGQDYIPVATLIPAGKREYTYPDQVTGAQTFFYRVKSINKDGSVSYSAVVKLRTSGQGSFLQIAPNPFTEKLHINIESLSRDKATLLLTDLSGRQLIRKSYLLNQGSNALEMDGTKMLSGGTYLLNFSTSAKTGTIKVIKGN